tara:strand:+ start:3003 stop:3134 length:132 start_codon:yes stop_codon:yes gene_type:complete
MDFTVKKVLKEIFNKFKNYKNKCILIEEKEIEEFYLFLIKENK